MRRSSPTAVLVVLCGGLFITGLDNTIVNVALPSIQGDLGATTSALQWVVDAYSVVFAGCLLLAGSLGDRFGRRRILIIGLVVFGLGSAAAGLAADATALAACRALMGVGGAFVMPSTLSIIVQAFPDRRVRARAIGVWAAVSGLGIALGPLVGGVLLEHFSWHSVFLVNPPLALAVIVATALVVPESSDPQRPRLDLLGAALWAVGLIALVVTIITLPESGWGLPVAASAAVTVGALLLFVLWERRAPRPILPLSLFRNRTFDVSVLLVALLYFSLFGAMFFFPQFLQLVQGMTPLGSGIAVLPGAGGLVVASVFSPRLAERFGARALVVLGMALVAVGLAAASWFVTDSPYWLVGGSLGLMGVGMGLTLPHATNGVLAAVPRERAGMGSAVNETIGEVGGALGVAVLGAMLSASYRSTIDAALASAGDAVRVLPAEALEAVRDSLVGASLVIAQLPAQYADPARVVAGEAFVSGMDAALWTGAVLAAVGVVIAALLFPRRMDVVDE